MREIPSFVYDPSVVLYLPLRKRDGASFISDDAYGRLVTATNAPWGIEGRTFNGTSSLISVGRITRIEGTTARWTIRGWFKMTDALTNSRVLFMYDDDDTLSGTLDLYMYWRTDLNALNFAIGGTESEKTSSITDLNDLGWHLIELSKTATTMIVREDGKEKDSMATTGNNYSSSHTFRIGDDANASSWKGLSDDIIIIADRTGSLLEHQQSYLETKWRYQ